MSVVEIDGARVAFRVDGVGPGLVLVHGTGGNSDTNWSELVGELSESRTVVRPDYSGSGDTGDGGHPLSAKTLAGQVVAAAKEAGATPFDIVGFSLGAAVSTYIAAEYPDLVRSVVLLAGFTSSTDPRQTMQFELWRDLITLDRHAMARFILLTGLSSEFLSKLGPDAIAEAAAQITANNNWDGMARQVELDLTIDLAPTARRALSKARRSP